MQARRDAMVADLLVVNHHLFFADMALRSGRGAAEAVLPTVRRGRSSTKPTSRSRRRRRSF